MCLCVCTMLYEIRSNPSIHTSQLSTHKDLYALMDALGFSSKSHILVHPYPRTPLQQLNQSLSEAGLSGRATLCCEGIE